MMSDVNGIGIVIMRDSEVVSPMGYVSGNGHISTSAIVECYYGSEVYVKVKWFIIKELGLYKTYVFLYSPAYNEHTVFVYTLWSPNDKYN